MAWAWQNGWLAIWPPAVWSLSAAWLVGWIPPRIAEPSAAHGRTIAVWGTGVDVVYPKENQKLSEQILEAGGAIVSEFPLGTFPAPQNFPIRNRIISGLSIGVLVLEAGEYSGTRVTARCALEQGREVYAVPGNVTNKLSWGPNTLIKQGAALVATWEDVWEELPADVRLALTPAEPRCIGGGFWGIIISGGRPAAGRKEGPGAIACGRIDAYRPDRGTPAVSPLLL